MENRSIPKENIHLDFLKIMANTDSPLTEAGLKAILANELNRIFDEIAEADNYHELTQDVAVQLISQLDVINRGDESRKILKELIELARNHGLFSRPDEDQHSNNAKKDLVFTNQKSDHFNPKNQTQSRNAAHKLLSTYSEKIKVVRFSEDTLFHSKMMSPTEKRMAKEKKEEAKIIKAYNEMLRKQR